MPTYDFRKDMDKLRELIGKPFEGVTSGLTALDNIITGFGKGELAIIGGRPSMGKSSLARDILLNVSNPDVDLGAALLFTMEMKTWEIHDCLSSTLSKVSYERIRKGSATEKERLRFDKAARMLDRYSIVVTDDSCITPDTIRSVIEPQIKQEKIACVIVDYLQLMSLQTVVESRQVEVSTISRELKNIAMDYDVPVIALSQLNRGSESRESMRPRMIDIRESGSLEQDATNIILMYRPGYYYTQHDANVEDDGEAELIVCKVRNGSTGVAKCAFIGAWTTFRDYPDGYEESQRF